MPRSATANIDVDTGIPVGITGPRKRWYHLDKFWRKPNLDAAFNVGDTSSDVGAAIERAGEANQYWNLVGADAVYTDLAFAANGGITIKPNGTADDQIGIEPLSVATYHIVGGSALTYPYNKGPAVEWGFTTTSSITNVIFWAGFITGIADAPGWTDAAQQDGAYLKWDSSASANWKIVNNVAGTDDTEIDTGIVVKASTAYSVKVSLDASSKAFVWIAEASDLGSGKVFDTVSAHTSSTMIPGLGLEQIATATAPTLDVNYVACGRDR